MEIKLAEYKDGKFEKFLELGKDFLFGGDFIALIEKMTLLGVWGFDEQISFKKDKKDPLNRFNGLFDGRTYGEGRFVLIKIAKNIKQKNINQDDVFLDETCLYNVFDWNKTVPTLLIKRKERKGIKEIRAKVIGNLHENPELFLKI